MALYFFCRELICFDNGSDGIEAGAQIMEVKDGLQTGIDGRLGFKVPFDGEALLGLHGYGVSLHSFLSPLLSFLYLNYSTSLPVCQDFFCFR